MQVRINNKNDIYKKGLKIAKKEHRAKAARERRQLWEGNEADNEGGDDDDVTLSSIMLRSEIGRAHV